MKQGKADQGLYRQSFEHDACGIGVLAQIKGVKSHQMLQDALADVRRQAVQVRERVAYRWHGQGLRGSGKRVGLRTATLWRRWRAQAQHSEKGAPPA